MYKGIGEDIYVQRDKQIGEEKEREKERGREREWKGERGGRGRKERPVEQKLRPW